MTIIQDVNNLLKYLSFPGVFFHTFIAIFNIIDSLYGPAFTYLTNLFSTASAFFKRCVTLNVSKRKTYNVLILLQ